MAILINDNYNLQACKPFDARYLNICSPWTSVSAVNTAIPTYRYTGLTVNIMGTEYWYKDGILDTCLIPKVLGGGGTLSGATNGLSVTGQKVKLGGNLTGNTFVTPVGANYLQLGTATNYAYVGTGSTSMNAQSGTHYSYVGTTKCYASITANDTLLGFPTTIGQVALCSITGQVDIVSGNITTGCATGIGLMPTGITVCSATPTNFAGMKYVDNYGANFTARSIPDAAWVTGRTSISGIQTANNGLTKYGTNIVLGGTLTGNTCICTLSNCLSIGCSVNSELTVNSTTVSAFHCSNSSNGSSISIYNTGLTLNNKISSISCSVSLGQNALIYGGCYHSSYVNRTLVDKEYVDKQVSGCSNMLKIKNVFGCTYYSTIADDVIAVSGQSNCPIYLPATPVLVNGRGQRVTVVDICGCALIDPIIVNGNGKNINNGTCSTINTDYGSVTFVYNGYFWSAIAFVN